MVAESDPDQWAIDAAGKLLQPPFLPIEVLLKIGFTRRGQQLSAQVVGPAVIRTNQASTGLPRCSAMPKGNTAMGTAVAKSTGMLSLGPGEQKWLIQHGDGQHLSRLEMADSCNRMPVVVGIGVDVPLMHLVAAVQRCRKERLIQHGFT